MERERGESLVMEALIGALKKNLGVQALGATVDALTLATGIPPSTLLSHLINHFQASWNDGGKILNEETNPDFMTAMLMSLSHLFKNSGDVQPVLSRLVCEVFVPLLHRLASEALGLQNVVVHTLCEMLMSKDLWEFIEASLLPYLMTSVLLSFKFENSNQRATNSLEINSHAAHWIVEEHINSQEPLKFGVACQLLALLVQGALEAWKKGVASSEKGSPKRFCEMVVSELLDPALLIFTQTHDDTLRHLTMRVLLPPLLKVVSEFDAGEDHYTGKNAWIPRNLVEKEIWTGCLNLFSRGGSERRETFLVLVTFANFLLPAVNHYEVKMDKDSKNFFDIRLQANFWEILRAGLVDGDSLTRKRALQVLKIGLFSSSEYKDIKKHDHHGVATNDDLLTKRERFAAKEARSLGVMLANEVVKDVLSRRQQWDAFLLLYEILEEYGTHLVEAAWKHQMSVLLPFLISKEGHSDGHLVSDERDSMLSLGLSFKWMTVLWHRGLEHDNPQVRRLVMVFFLDVKWELVPNISAIISENFLLGIFIPAFNDPVHQKDFGRKGIYTSESTSRATQFIESYSASLNSRENTTFVAKLSKSTRERAFSRAGFMTLAMFVEAAAVATVSHTSGTQNGVACRKEVENILEQSGQPAISLNSSMMCADLLSAFSDLIEDSKKHFNPNYRLKVCYHVLKAATALVTLSEVPFSKLAHFLSFYPREHLVQGGVLHDLVRTWVRSLEDEKSGGNVFNAQIWLASGLHDMAVHFLKPVDFSSSVTLSDEEVEKWKVQAENWARMISIGLLEPNCLCDPILFLQQSLSGLYHRVYNSDVICEKALLLLSSLLKECSSILVLGSNSSCSDTVLVAEVKTRLKYNCCLQKHLTATVYAILDELVSHAKRSTEVFFKEDCSTCVILPASVTGRLGGPSQRRLSFSLTSEVLQGVLAVVAVSDSVVWLQNTGSAEVPHFAIDFVWEFFWHVVTAQTVKNQVEAEVRLAAHEALAGVCRALATSASASVISRIKDTIKVDGTQTERFIDALVWNFIQSADMLFQHDHLARSRQAVLLEKKWYCLDYLLSIPEAQISISDVKASVDRSAITISTVKAVLHDAIDSLEYASEESLLPLFRCIRWTMQWNCLLHTSSSGISVESKIVQVMWSLVKSSWAAVADCNKRRVAAFAAFLSSVLHPNAFGILAMHIDGDMEGPYKWLLGRLIEQGYRSPRTMRLTALHVTGLWLHFPDVAQHYIEEMKCFSLHGGEAVDEELDGEIEDQSTAREYLSLMQSSDPELVEEFTNSEMYARVTVATLMYKFSEIVDAATISEREIMAPAKCGKKLLFELLNTALTDPNLSKELYKKKSAIHRRKIRLWQMLCILSRFIDENIIEEVMELLRACIYLNNISSVRHYIEVFAVLILLRFPHLVKKHLVPCLLDYNMRTQALSSYVFIATNLLTHVSPEPLRRSLVESLLPAILPYLTTHHHNLRSFSQILVYRVLHQVLKMKPACDLSAIIPLEEKCLQSIISYLDGNTDCKKMRVSIEDFVDVFKPELASTPRGIFSVPDGEQDPSKILDNAPFECAPLPLMDHVAHFLSVAREDLRDTMAENAVILKNEELDIQARPSRVSKSGKPQASGNLDISTLRSDKVEDKAWDFQKKIASLRLSDYVLGSLQTNQGTQKNSDMLMSEEDLIDMTMESRVQDLVKMSGSRQDIILVASLLGRIPNLAGLVRTCEVFKVSTLVLADASILHDKQFKLISVTAEMWVPMKEVPEASLQRYLQVKKREGYALLGLEQTANSISLATFSFPNKTVLVLGKEKEGIPVNMIQDLDACIEIPQLGVIRSLNVHVSGAIALWEYTRQHIAR